MRPKPLRYALTWLLAAPLTNVLAQSPSPAEAAFPALTLRAQAPGDPQDPHALPSEALILTPASENPAPTSAPRAVPATPGLAPALAASAAPTLPGIVLRATRTYVLPLPPPENKVLFIRADQIVSQTDVEMVAQGHAELRRQDVVITSDELHYLPPSQNVQASGNVHLQRRAGMTVDGPYATYNLDTHQGYVDTPTFSYQGAAPAATNRSPSDGPPPPPWNARGQAQLLEFVAPDQEKLLQSQYTTCLAGRSDWAIQSSEVDLNHTTQEGVAHQGTIDFYGTPLLYAPELSFPLDNQRRSGLLAPTIGSTSTTGQDVSVPYYFNLAPNLDDTFSPRFMSLRGLQLGNQFRYLEPGMGGTLTTEYMQRDLVTGTSRWYGTWIHSQQLLPGLNFNANVQTASDPNYLVDLSSLLGPPGLAYLPRNFTLTYSGFPGWDLEAHSVSYQNLVGATPQFTLSPQLAAHWSHYNDTGPNYDFSSQYTVFNSPGPGATPGNVTVQGITYNANYQSISSGNRLVLNPSVSLPWRSSAGYVVFKTGLNLTQYQLTEYNTAPQNNYSRLLPITSVDSGLFFDRNTHLLGRDFEQTLEPRLYYVYIPYRNQDQLPVFDTALADLNRATIFTENRYDGIDRINNANQVTAAVTTRLIDASTGIEYLNALLGQRFYFTPNAVLLPGQLPTPPQASDVLVALTASISQRWKLDSYFNFNSHNLQTQQMMATTSYSPAPGKVVNLSYRIDTPVPGVPNVITTPTSITTLIPGINSPVPINELTAIKQWDVSSEWPINAQVAFLGRLAYSTLDNKMVEGLMGVEYNQGCWALRLINTRFAVTSVQTDAAIYIQLELGGMGLGQNPMVALRRNIPGYLKTNEITP